MKIAFLASGQLYSDTHPFSQGGVQSQILGISKELIKHGHEVQIIGRFENGSLNGLEEEIKMGIKFINIKTPKLGSNQISQILSKLLYSRNASKLIKKANPDIINLGDYYSAYFPSKLSIPKVYITHNIDAFPSYRSFDIKINRINYIFFYFKNGLETRVMERANAVVALNTDILSYLVGKNFKNVYYIPNGVEIEHYYCRTDDNFILYGGRFHKIKGIEYLINAFSEICNDYDVNLRLIGGGPEEEALRLLVKLKGIENRVEFKPFLGNKEFREDISKCTIFVLPSFHETFGVVMIEAMASYKPVIASNIPGPKDIIIHGYTGFLFESGNATELKDYLEFCLSNKYECKKIGSDAREVIASRYTFEKITSEYMDLYKKVINENAD